MTRGTPDSVQPSHFWNANLDVIPPKAVVRCPMCTKAVFRGGLELHVRDEHYHYDDRRSS